MGRNRNSRYTVCGQPKPHHTRPNVEPTKNTVTTTPKPNAASSRLSVGWNVAPNMWKRRVARSSSNGRVLADRDERQREEQHHQRVGDAPADVPVVPLAHHRVHEPALAVGREAVEQILLGRDLEDALVAGRRRAGARLAGCGRTVASSAPRDRFRRERVALGRPRIRRIRALQAADVRARAPPVPRASARGPTAACPWPASPWRRVWKICSTEPPWIQRSSVRFGPMSPCACSPWHDAHERAKREAPTSSTAAFVAPASSSRRRRRHQRVGVEVGLDRREGRLRLAAVLGLHRALAEAEGVEHLRFGDVLETDACWLRVDGRCAGVPGHIHEAQGGQTHRLWRIRAATTTSQTMRRSARLTE